jgi:Fe2+ transport system protein FeoA
MSIIACPMCATEYDPRDNRACELCPLGAGCHLACCPTCGYTTVDPQASRLAGWFSRAARRRHRPRRHGRILPEGLGAVPTGQRVILLNLNRLPHGKRRRLEAMGLKAGDEVEVLAQRPVTVIRVGHAQLAISTELSCLIDVLPASPVSARR